jgi:hypothetical protein
LRIMGRKSKDKRQREVRAGDVFGLDGMVLSVDKPDKQGHRLVLVRWMNCDRHCKHCHGEPQMVRADNLRSRRIVSCGKRKAKLYRDWIQTPWRGVVDVNGKPIPKTYNRRRDR